MANGFVIVHWSHSSWLMLRAAIKTSLQTIIKHYPLTDWSGKDQPWRLPAPFHLVPWRETFFYSEHTKYTGCESFLHSLQSNGERCKHLITGSHSAATESWRWTGRLAPESQQLEPPNLLCPCSLSLLSDLSFRRSGQQPSRSCYIGDLKKTVITIHIHIPPSERGTVKTLKKKKCPEERAKVSRKTLKEMVACCIHQFILQRKIT